MCCADFDVASGLPGENRCRATSFVISAQSTSNWTSFAHKSLTVFIQQQTSLFEESGVRKRTDSYWTLLHFFWVFGLNSGECAHKSFVQCFNQLCWVSRQREGRKTLTKTPEYILHYSGERKAHTHASGPQNKHVILKTLYTELSFCNV